jgi:adenosylcobinamide-phosphate synthase
MWLVNPLQILAAIVVDQVIGDPHGCPHIARCSGALSTFYEKWLTRYFPRSILLGLLFWFLVVGTTVGGYVAVRFVCSLINPILSSVLDILVIYQAIAAKDLHHHAKMVMQALVSGDLGMARARLSFMVGRDTRDLDASEISRATIESVAESLVDGMVAPLFWAVIGGAAGALIYRTANTLDSMVGHRTPAYERFGKASALIDDLLNWAPARLCALLICLFHVRTDLPKVWREAGAHASPNAGWPEAAMAYALGVRLGGTNFYDGVPIQGPIFNVSGRVAGVGDIKISLSRIWWVVLAAGGACLLLALILPAERKGNHPSLDSVNANRSDFAPQGLEDSARGFNPWLPDKDCPALKGRQSQCLEFVGSGQTNRRSRISSASSGRIILWVPSQGLKPLADSWSPFGTKIAILLIDHEHRTSTS